MSAFKASLMAGAIALSMAIAGCANIPLREGGLAIDKDTTVGIEDLGVASVTRGF